jgi:hypothetical protein
LEGITEETIQKNNLKSVSCCRCRRNNHFTIECFAKRTEAGEILVDNKINDEKKRKAPEKDRGDAKKLKTAGIKTEQEEEKEKRIWDLDSDFTENFCICLINSPSDNAQCMGSKAHYLTILIPRRLLKSNLDL